MHSVPLLTVLFLAVWTSPSAQAKSPHRSSLDSPNVIIILADDLGCGDTSLYDGWIETPHLEAMAREGVKFTDFHTNSSVCSPTRIALLTGRYQQRLGIVDVIVGHRDKDGLEPDQFTLPRMFKSGGYQTAIFGKWHCGTQPSQNPTQHGFDEFVGFLTGGSNYRRQNHWLEGTEVKGLEGYTTHLITDKATDFIRRQKDQAFFLYVSHAAVHNPYQTPEDGVTANSKINDENREKYKRMLRELDRGVGKILETVQDLGIDEKTLILFFSDNGAVRMNPGLRPYRGGKFSNYEGGHRVPSVARWPGRIKAGWVSDALVVGMDLLPTLAQLTNLTLPEGRHFDGLSIHDHLLDQTDLPPRDVFFGYEPKLGTAMRSGSWKLQTKEGRLELYDLGQDIKEQHNLVDEYPERAARMNAKIERWKQEVRPSED